ncbi:MAG: phage tail length tape measure family protein, partial [Proteobacteria bacterium]|nr:phage tail length tape measure family protein [Pseudomonadota bacterium]
MSGETELQLIFEAINRTDKVFNQIHTDLRRTNREVRSSAKTWTESGKQIQGSLSQVAGQFGAAGGPAGSLLGVLQQFGPVAGVVAGVVVVVTALGKAIHEGTMHAAEWERKMGRTEALIRSTGGAAGLTAWELEGLAKNLDKATLSDKTGILDAINALQTFKAVSGDAFERAIGLTVDLAEILGTQPRSAALQLGKALEDPVRQLSTLRESGISFSMTQERMIKGLAEAGNLMAAQSEILTIIENQLGGAAAGAGSGLLGKMDRLGYEWREFLEGLEQTDLYTLVIEKLTEDVTNLRHAISGMTPEEELEGIAKGIGELEEKIRAAQTTLQDFRGEESAYANEVRMEIEERIAAHEREIEALNKKKEQIKVYQRDVEELRRPEKYAAERAAADQRGQALLEAKLKAETEAQEKTDQERTKAREKAAQEAERQGKQELQEAERLERERQALEIKLSDRVVEREDPFKAKEAQIRREAELNRERYKNNAETVRLINQDELQALQELAVERGKARAEEAGKLAEAKELALRESRDASAGMIRALRDYGDEATNVGVQVEDAMGSAMSSVEDKTIQALQGVKVAWQDMLSALEADVFRMVVRQNITGPAASALSEIASSLFHEGGEVGRGAPVTRTVN